MLLWTSYCLSTCTCTTRPTQLTDRVDGFLAVILGFAHAQNRLLRQLKLFFFNHSQWRTESRELPQHTPTLTCVRERSRERKGWGERGKGERIRSEMGEGWETLRLPQWLKKKNDSLHILQIKIFNEFEKRFKKPHVHVHANMYTRTCTCCTCGSYGMMEWGRRGGCVCRVHTPPSWLWFGQWSPHLRRGTANQDSPLWREGQVHKL